MKAIRERRWLAATALACFLPLAASALTITYTFSGGSPISGEPVNVSAIFTTGADSINVTLNNLLPNPTSVGQLLSDLRFTVGGVSTTGATLTSSTGTHLTVNADDSYSLGSSGPTGWALTSPTSSTLYLNVLGTPDGPSHLIIGPSNNGTFSGGTYASANGSIAGNAPHNPFLMSGALYTIGLTGVTASTTITGAAFSFGTTAGLTEAQGVPSSGPAPSVPDGGETVLLLGLGLIGLVAVGRLLQRHDSKRS